MPLYVKDDAVDDLAIKYQKAIGARSKTDAVRKALKDALAATHSEKSVLEEIAEIQAEFAALGPVDPNFDQKAVADELWEIE